MENSEYVHQYPLCYIQRKHGATAITQADITPMVGSTETPFVTAMLQTVSLDVLLGKWQDELNQWVANEEKEFNDWFAGLHDILDSNVAGNLLNLIHTKADIPIVTSVSLTVAGWTGAESPFKQNVTIANAPADSLVSIQLSDDVYKKLTENGTTMLRIDNVDGTFIATAIGEKPNTDLTVQVSVIMTKMASVNGGG